MADHTDDRHANVVNLRPRPDGTVPPPPPPLPPAPRPSLPADRDAPTGPEKGAAPAGGLPGLPGVEKMGVPFALMMPPIPPAAEAEGQGEGEFVPPAPADPDHPTGRETLQVCMAIVTAMGVAAAQGMWHRARHRQALADQARAGADKAAAKTAVAGHHGGGRGGGTSTSSRHEGGSRRRPHGGHAGGHDGSPSRHRRRHKRSGDSDSDSHGRDSHKRSKDRRGPKAPKATTDGRTAPGTARTKHRRDKRGRDQGGLGDRSCVRTRERRPDAKRDAKRDGTASPMRPDTVRWKAPRKSRPGPDGDKALPSGRKRWKRTEPKPGSMNSKDSKGSKSSKSSKSERNGKRRTSWLRWTWKSSPAWLKGWRIRRTAAGPASSTSATGSAGSQGGHQAGGRQSWGRWAPPPPPPGGEWMRPPPGADRSTRVTVERVDERPLPAEPAVLTGAPAAGWLALPPAAAAGSPTPTFRRTAAPPAANGTPPTAATTTVQTNGGQMTQASPFIPAPRTTQYRDAELTVYDVIEADADMAEEITEGVDEARATAAGCERLMSKLEAVHAEIVDLQVPGVLAGMLLRLIDKTLTVKARAEAIAANLPAAAEAIATAGSNAAARHQNLADVTRDMGHVRPAEREYHQD